MSHIRKNGLALIFSLIMVLLMMFSFSTLEANNETFVANEIIVKYKPGTDISKLVNNKKGSLGKKNDKLRVAKVKVPKGAKISDELKKYKNDSAVEYAEPNYYYSINMTPNDPQIGAQWAITKMRVNEAWDTTTGSNAIIIAIVDTGVQTDHQDLENNIVTGYNTIDNSTNVADDHGHGTHVAGIAAASINNSVGIAGIAGTSKIMPLKAMGANGVGSTTDISEAIVWAADNGAKIINLSLSATVYTQTMQDAINYAFNKGAIVIAAAGNENTSTKRYPAAMDNVLAVSATDTNNNKASFSNYGTHVDIAAPGVSILSTLRNSGYGYMQGTSMAAPYVAGVAALILSDRPSLTPGHLTVVLTSSAKDIGTAGKDTYFGHGLIDAQAALTQSVDTSPVGLSIIGASPNPYAPKGSNNVAINFNLGKDAYVTVRVLDSSNQIVKTVATNVFRKTGKNSVLWNGKNALGVLMPSGLYTYEISAKDAANNQSSPMSGNINVDRTLPAIDSVSPSNQIFAPSGNNSISIDYYLSENCLVNAKVYDSKNALVATLLSNKLLEAGNQTLTWNGKNTKGIIVGDDTYTIKIDATDLVGWKAVQKSAACIIETQAPIITNAILTPLIFNPNAGKTSTLKYNVSETSNMTVEVYNSSNALIRTLFTGKVSFGNQQITWNGRDNSGLIVPTGAYTIRVDARDMFDKVAPQLSKTVDVDITPPVISDIQNVSIFDPSSTNSIAFDYVLSEKSLVTVKVYNSKNVLVGTLLNNIALEAGNQTFNWSGKNTKGVILGDDTYSIRIDAVDLAGIKAVQKSSTCTIETKVPSITDATVSQLVFNPNAGKTSTLKYTISETANMTIGVYNSSNTLVRNLFAGKVFFGSQQISWNGRDNGGAIVPTGSYTIRVDARDMFDKAAPQVSKTVNVDVTSPVISNIQSSNNPFVPSGNNQCTFSYSISENSKVTVAIYTSSNQLVRTISPNLSLNAGDNFLIWNGRNSRNLVVAPGNYKVRIKAVDLVGLSDQKEFNFLVQ